MGAATDPRDMTGEITVRIDRNELLRLLDMMKPPATMRRTSEIAALLPPSAPTRRKRPTLTMPILAIRPIAPPSAPVAVARVPTPEAPAIEARVSRLAMILERFAGFLFAGLC